MRVVAMPKQLSGEQDSVPGRVSLIDVMIVDDDPAMGQTVVEILGLHDVTAVAVTSPNAAIARQRELRPAVVICDQRLPDISGLELCTTLRTIDPDVSLILLTGHASLDTAIAAVGLIDQYLTKPVPPAELVAAVATAITQTDRRRSDRVEAENLRQQLEADLRRQALHDALTGLPNRSLFVERASHAVDRRDPRPAVICFLDLDDFKDVNDSLGHGAGDDLLRVVAARLTDCLRPEDTVARFGGDEFAILLENTDLAVATEIVERIHSSLNAPIPLADTEVTIHASIGVSATAGEPTSSEQLLAEADIAMYAAKTRGRHQFEIFDPVMRDVSERRARTRIEIEQALARDEFRLHYQPILSLETGVRCGVEALIRWNHPTRGLLAPGEFIRHAESSGQIIAIGRWVLEAACHDIAQWHGDGWLSVNVSARELSQPDIVETVAACLAASGLTPERLVIEITETAAVVDPGRALHKLEALKSLGVQLALDDFGTGYSSLSYLREFPVDHLKIDQSFVTALSADDGGRAIVQGVVDIAHALGIKAVAEGIEQPVQREILAELNCDYGQGYLWAPPTPLSELDT